MFSGIFPVGVFRLPVGLLLFCRFVGTDNVLYQLVADNIAVGELADRNVVDLSQNAGGNDQTAFLLVRQVDLRGVARGGLPQSN